jgi:hypothetical protein
MVRDARPVIVAITGARMLTSAISDRKGSSLEQAGQVASVACFPSVRPTAFRHVASTTWQRVAASTTWQRAVASTTWQAPRASTTWQAPRASTTWQAPRASTTWQRGVENRPAA